MTEGNLPSPEQQRPSIFSATEEAASGGSGSHPGFTTEGSRLDEMTGVNPADLGITRRQLIFGAIGGLLTLCGIGGVVAFLGLKGTEAVSSNPDKLSTQYEELMGDAGVQKYAKNLSTEDKKRFFYNLTTTNDYLQEADNSQWGGLVKHLEAEGPKAFYGQMLALSKPNPANPAGCLASNKTISYNLTTNISSCDVYPGFKNLDAKTKQQYVTKFNAMAEELKP